MQEVNQGFIPKKLFSSRKVILGWLLTVCVRKQELVKITLIYPLCTIQNLTWLR